MFRGLKTAFKRSEADKLVAVLDAQRAEQRNAESYLTRLREARDAVVRHLGPDAPDHAATRLDAHDREIDSTVQRIKRALKLQAQLAARLGEAPGATADRRN